MSLYFNNIAKNLRRRNFVCDTSPSEVPSPDFLYELKDSLITKTESEFLSCIKSILPNGYFIQVQANLATTITRPQRNQLLNQMRLPQINSTQAKKAALLQPLYMALMTVHKYGLYEDSVITFPRENGLGVYLYLFFIE